MIMSQTSEYKTKVKPSVTREKLFQQQINSFRQSGDLEHLIAGIICLCGNRFPAINLLVELGQSIKVGDAFHWRIQILFDPRKDREYLTRWNRACCNGLRACGESDKLILSNLKLLLADQEIDITDPETVRRAIHHQN